MSDRVTAALTHAIGALARHLGGNHDFRPHLCENCMALGETLKTLLKSQLEDVR